MDNKLTQFYLHVFQALALISDKHIEFTNESKQKKIHTENTLRVCSDNRNIEE